MPTDSASASHELHPFANGCDMLCSTHVARSFKLSVAWPMSAWSDAAQILLSCGTVAIAFAVYRIQSDTLFVALRDKRGAAIDRFVETGLETLRGISDIGAPVDPDPWKAQPRVPVGLHESMMAFSSATRDIANWFGPEVVLRALQAEGAVIAAEQAAMAWAGNADTADWQKKFDANNFARHEIDMVKIRTYPYTTAGRRGLPLFVERVIRTTAETDEYLTKGEFPKPASPDRGTSAGDTPA